MARYYLHLRDSVDIAIDEEGCEFDSIEALKAFMIRSARDTMTGDIVHGRLDLTLRIDAETADGIVAATIPFTDAIEIKYPDPEPLRATG